MTSAGDDNAATLLEEAKRAVKHQELDRAADLLQQVLAAKPRHLKALDLLGFVRFFQKRYAECEQLCREALAIKPDHAYALSGLGMALARQGALEAGVAMLEKAMSLSPAWPEPYWDTAIVLSQAKQTKRAIAVLEKGIDRAPKAADRFRRLLSKLQSQST